MKHRLKKNTAAEDAYARELEKRGPLQKVETGEAKLLSEQEYPEPIRRFIARERNTLRIPLSPSAKRKLERLSRASKVDATELAQRWIQQGLAREAG
jgi:hypothetical protein